VILKVNTKNKSFMRLIAVCALCLVWLLSTAAGKNRGPATASPAKRLDALLLKPDAKIDLAQAVLAVSKERNPSLDVNKYLAQLDTLTQNVKRRIKPGSSAEQIIEALRQSIHKEGGFGYLENVDEQGLPTNPDEIYMHGLLDNKRGYCMTLSLLYLIVGERLNLPLHGVALPNHFFVRYDSGKIRINIETTEGGVTRPDSFYMQQFGVPEGERDQYFMRNLGKKQSLGAYFANVGTFHFKAGKPDSALAYLKFAAAANPAATDIQNNLANIFAEMKKYDEAIRHYNKALKADPGNPSTLFNLGATYAEAGKDREAIETLLQVLQIDPSFAEAHAEIFPLFLKQKKYHSALLHIRKLLEQNPENLEIHLTLASVYTEMDLFELALESLREAQSLFPESEKIIFHLAEVYYRMEDYDKAMFHYRYLLERDPENFSAYVQMGWTNYRKSDLKSAISWTKRGLTLNSLDARVTALAHMNLGFYHLLERDFNEAEFWYKQALMRPDANALAGMVSDLQEARERFPELAEVEYFTGWIYREHGETAESEKYLRRFIKRGGAVELMQKARQLLSTPRPGKPARTKNEDTTPQTQKTAFIPAGFFNMGADNRGPDERPAHKVFLDAFYIDRYEVTAREFAEFLNTVNDNRGYYMENKFGILERADAYRPRPGREKFPINNVSWFGAEAYCKWKKHRLPTEAEWEKAARGDDGRLFPWGNNPPAPALARFQQTWSDATTHSILLPVDSLPEGQSPFGVLHMAGNVKEWVDDWYDREYYSDKEHATNPKGPIGGEFKVLRGGSWHDLPGFLASPFRNYSPPDTLMDDYGFRCVWSETDSAPKKLIRYRGDDARAPILKTGLQAESPAP
jgi:formylglycine-generating enzyme required for sulfatase activity/cytochrome c-type biogenesis protein CcmH/NrfG